MRFAWLFPVLAGGAVCSAPALFAQQTPTQRPTAEQARAALQARPELVQQLRQRLVTSGMTREQIHARLRAEGYPEDLLDAYLPGSGMAAQAPTSDLYSAIQELGIADSSDVSVLRLLQTDTLPPNVRDSLLRSRDTLFRTDSLGRREPRRMVVRADVEDSIARLDSGFNIFGFEMFRSGATRVEASVLGPVDDSYRLGPGDRLVLILTGDVESSLALDVTREGFVLIPQVGVVSVSNLTLGQLNDVLYSRLGRVYSGIRRGASATTRFSLSVSRLRTNQVYVLGEVERPGSYMVSSAGSALTSLYAAGGPTANGSLRQVQIRRGGKTVSTVDLYDYLLRGDASRDARLETGDIVFVPARGMRVRVLGEVVRPATYELKPNETLADLLASAGGFNSDALQRRVQIQRVLPAGQRTSDGRERTTIDVASGNLMNGGGSAVPLAGGDVVRVFAVSERVRNTVSVEGDVWNPGQQGLTPGMTVSMAIRVAGGLKPDAYLGQVLVSRLHGDSTRTQLRAVFRDTSGAVVGDFTLQEDDVIEVFSLTDFRPERYVAIGGAVNKGGRFPYRRGITIRDLVLLAGGLREGAYLKEAEIARLPQDRTGSATAATLRVPLDSTYLFERKPGEAYLGAPGLPAQPNGAPEVELQPYDNVLIMQQPSWELQRVVTLAGEVKFPGQYALKTRNERLADIVDRAGGFTAEAYPEGTVFIRRQGDVGRAPLEIRVAIDVPQAMSRRTSPENMLLLDGDQVTVPQRSTIVTVRGSVNAPNVVAYVPGKSLRFYVNQAGGAARESDYKRAFVTQPSGKREATRARWWFWDHVPKPLPGSIVVVPQRDANDRGGALQTLAALAPILTGLATLYLAVR
ncbi:MAG: SLBB domain-containing protein [Gemmatimonadota bacterium]